MTEFMEVPGVPKETGIPADAVLVRSRCGGTTVFEGMHGPPIAIPPLGIVGIHPSDLEQARRCDWFDGVIDAS